MSKKPTPDEPANTSSIDPVDDSVDEADTTGHSLLTYEYSRNVATSRAREADDWARQERLRKEAKQRKR